MVEYIYDSWGRILSVTGTLTATLGADQPFRYRGYVYDEETQWYYLQSRYYDPNTCRFISADVLLSTGQGVIGHNSFAYCLNNPVNLNDPDGYFPGMLNISVMMADNGGGAGGNVMPLFNPSSGNQTVYTDYNPEGRGDILFDWDGDSLCITAYVTFSGEGADYAFIKDSIESYWSGLFYANGKTIKVKTTIIQGASPSGDSLAIFVSPEEGRSGSMYLYCGGRTTEDIAWTAAHEFGHQIGLLDAYHTAPNGSCKYAPFKSIMNRRFTPVQSIDIHRVIAYIETGIVQTYSW